MLSNETLLELINYRDALLNKANAIDVLILNLTPNTEPLKKESKSSVKLVKKTKKAKLSKEVMEPVKKVRKPYTKKLNKLNNYLCITCDHKFLANPKTEDVSTCPSCLERSVVQK